MGVLRLYYSSAKDRTRRRSRACALTCNRLHNFNFLPFPPQTLVQGDFKLYNENENPTTVEYKRVSLVERTCVVIFPRNKLVRCIGESFLLDLHKAIQKQLGFMYWVCFSGSKQESCLERSWSPLTSCLKNHPSRSEISTALKSPAIVSTFSQSQIPVWFEMEGSFCMAIIRLVIPLCIIISYILPVRKRVPMSTWALTNQSEILSFLGIYDFIG